MLALFEIFGAVFLFSAFFGLRLHTITTSTSQLVVTSVHYTVTANASDCDEYLVMNLLRWPCDLCHFINVCFLKKVSYEKFRNAAFFAREIVDLQVRISKNLMLHAHWQHTLPWITFVGLSNPGQMRSPRDTYVSARWRAFHISVASYFCVTSY